MVDLTTREWERASRQFEGGTATNLIGGSREEGWHFFLLGWDGRTILLVQGNDGYWNLCPKETTHGNGKVINVVIKKSLPKKITLKFKESRSFQWPSTVCSGSCSSPRWRLPLLRFSLEKTSRDLSCSPTRPHGRTKSRNVRPSHLLPMRIGCVATALYDQPTRDDIEPYPEIREESVNLVQSCGREKRLAGRETLAT